MAESTWIADENPDGTYDLRANGRMLVRDLDVEEIRAYVGRRDPKAVEVTIHEADGHRSKLRVRRR